MPKQLPVVAVFFGGTPSNYDLSRQTGQWVCQYIPRAQYRVVPVHVTPHGQWQVPLGTLPTQGDMQRMLDRLFEAVPAMSPAQGMQRLLRHPVATLMTVLRGKGGDDGSLHHLGQSLHIPVMGSPAATCARTSDKYLLYRSLESVVATPYTRAYKQTAPLDEVMRELRADIPAPLFIKPLREEGSHGVQRAQTHDDAYTALQQSPPPTDVVIQEAAAGTEISVTLVENDRGKVQVLPPTIIQPTKAIFYDASAKQRAGYVNLHTTTDVTPDIEEAIAAARDIYDALGCRGYAAIDMIMSPDGPVVLEVNTIPTSSPYTPFIHQLRQAELAPTTLLDHWLKRTLNGGHS